MKIKINTRKVSLEDLNLDPKTFKKLKKRNISSLEDVSVIPKNLFKEIGIGKNRYNNLMISIANYLLKDCPAVRDVF